MQATETLTSVAAISGTKEIKLGTVLVVGPGPRGRGGIAAVIRMHQRTQTWSRRKAYLLETFDDRSSFHKVRSALAAYLAAPYRLMRADLLHLHLAAQTSLLRKLPILAMAKLLRKPVIVHLHPPSKECLFVETPRWARRFVFRSASRVIALSQSWADDFASYEPRARFVVMANPVQILEPVQLEPGTPPIILFVGKLEARKGYTDLLHAAKQILVDYPEAQFWFAGHGETQAAQAQSDRLGISHAVHLLGWVDGADLGAIYRQASIVALPSYAEGVPMSIIEAMSHGIPVVCTPVGGLPELIQDRQNGLFVTPGDSLGLAHQISRLLNYPKLAHELGMAGRATVQQRCSVDDISDALDALYADVLGEAVQRKATV